jgi:hypothetical protein
VAAALDAYVPPPGAQACLNTAKQSLDAALTDPRWSRQKVGSTIDKLIVAYVDGLLCIDPLPEAELDLLSKQFLYHQVLWTTSPVE